MAKRHAQSAPCVCVIAHGRTVRPCLLHYAQLSDPDRRRVRLGLRLHWNSWEHKPGGAHG